MNEKDKKYKLLFNELNKGTSLTKICNEKKLCINNVRKQLKKRYPNEYEELVYGKIICTNKGNEIRKIPNNHANSNECLMTKKAKEILIKEFDCIEEVGIWQNNFSKRICVDLFQKRNKIGFELYWRSSETTSKLITKLNRYRKFCNDVVCVLLRDSKTAKKTFIIKSRKLKETGFTCFILDIEKPHPLGETPIFPVELKKM